MQCDRSTGIAKSAFWFEEPPLQDQFAVYGQKSDATGNKQWENYGMPFTSQSSSAMSSPFAMATDTSVYVMSYRLI